MTELHKQITLLDVRSFTLGQFEQIKKSNEKKKLIQFHTINKYLFMAHNQKEFKILGNQIANLKNKPVNLIFDEYEFHLKKILNTEATVKSNSNVLNKIYSHFRKKLTLEEKNYFLKLICNFKNEKITLGKLLNQVDFFIDKYENGFLRRQTFYLLYSDIEETDFFQSNPIG